MTLDQQELATRITRLADRLQAAPEGDCNGNRCVMIPAQVLAVIISELRLAAHELCAAKGWQTR